VDANRNDAQHAAKRQRTGVAHEDAGRMAVEPEKAKAAADQRRAKYRELTGAG